MGRRGRRRRRNYALAGLDGGEVAGAQVPGATVTQGWGADTERGEGHGRDIRGAPKSEVCCRIAVAAMEDTVRGAKVMPEG